MHWAMTLSFTFSFPVCFIHSFISLGFVYYLFHFLFLSFVVVFKTVTCSTSRSPFPWFLWWCITYIYVRIRDSKPFKKNKQSLVIFFPNCSFFCSSSILRSHFLHSYSSSLDFIAIHLFYPLSVSFVCSLTHSFLWWFALSI